MPARSASKRTPVRRYLLARLAGLLLLLGLAGATAAGVSMWRLSAEVPLIDSLDHYRPKVGSRLYALDGSMIAEFAVEKRIIIPYDYMPRNLILAFIAAEDSNFFNHAGFDPMGILRAAMKNLQAGKVVQGGSTITQQVAKSFLSSERTWRRKLKEAVLARRLERHLTKEEILYLYLNQIYLGHGAYGVQSAAIEYFGRNVWELSLAEMATIAGMPRAPSRFSPYRFPERAAERKTFVLERMLEEGFIDRQQHDRALAEQVQVVELTDLMLDRAPDFSEHVRKYLKGRYGDQALYEGGLEVHTTLELDAEKWAQDAVFQGLRMLDHRQGYRGPLGRIAMSDADRFRELSAGQYAGEGGLLRNRKYVGLVVRADGRGADVSVGGYTARIPPDTMRWARTPTHLAGLPGAVSESSRALRPGDLVLVRPSDMKRAFRDEDWRSTEPIGDDDLIFVLEQEPESQGALLAKDPVSGYVGAMIGGYNFEASEFNRAFQACRQPGSAFKPIIYTAAIDKGWTPSTIIIDSPIVADDFAHDRRWKPANYDVDFRGDTTLRDALMHSRNIPAIKTLEFVGIPTAADYAVRMGLTTAINMDFSMALGSSCVTLNELVNVFSHFPLGGLKPETVFVRSVADREGELLEDNTVYYDPFIEIPEKLEKMGLEAVRDRERVFDQQTAYLMTYLLRQVVEGGTGAAARVLNRPLGGKTGTTNDFFDAWFVGFTPRMVTGVWIGNDHNRYPLGPGETGGRAALPIWIDFMRRYLKDRPINDFPVPDGIVFALVDPETGLLAQPGSGRGISVPFRTGSVPDQTSVAPGDVHPDEFMLHDSGR